MRKRNIKKQIWLDIKEDVQNLRMKYIEEVIPLKAEREKLRQLYKKTTNETDKSIIRAEINIITEDINKINSKIQTCKRIISRAEKGEKETVLINNRALENQQNNEQENSINRNKDKKELDRSTF